MTKPTIQERYRAAVHSRDMTVDPKTFRSDSDVAGAYGLADKRLCAGGDHNGDFPPSPLSVPLERFFAGDGRAASTIVEILALMAYKRARHLKVRCNEPTAQDMAKACLAWHRDGKCKHCGGHGFEMIPGAPTLSERPCSHCLNGRIPLEAQFPPELRELAGWMVSQMERAAGRAGPAAMQAIAGGMP